VRLIFPTLLLFVAAVSAFGQATPLSDPYQPITGKGRLEWFARSTARSATTSNILSAAIGTARGSPQEYPNTWEGFGKRYRNSLAGSALGNAMESSIGAIWGEDPRYFRYGGPFEKATLKARSWHIIKSAFLARDREGRWVPAYARYIAVPGNNFIANSWRVESESDVGSTLGRTALGFAGRMGGNAFHEFWPDVWQLISRKKNP
jgi:hypothetical protein